METIEYYSERDIPYSLEVDIDYVNEKGYGADADGNRGVNLTVVDSFKIVSIKNLDTGKDIQISYLSPAFINEIHNRISDEVYEKDVN